MSFIKKIFFHTLIAVGVSLAIWFSHFYRFPQHEAPIVILGSGIILGLIFRMGAKVLPALFIGLLVSHYQLIGYSFLVSLWISSSMLISGWLAFIYIRKTLSHSLIDQPVRNFLNFYVAAIVISPLANLLLDLPLMWMGQQTVGVDDIRLLIFSYTFGEAFGSLVFTPAIVLFGQQFHQDAAYADNSTVSTEKILWYTAAVFLVLLTLYMGETYFFAGLLDAELLLYPMVVWSALRLGVKFTNIAVAIMAYTIFTFHFFGIAGTSGAMSIPQVLGMLLLIITLAVLAQLVAAITLERRKKEQLLEHNSLHDPVTGLPNVRYLHKSMTDLAALNQQEKISHMLGYISICNYDALVQGYGIEAQNALYCQFSGFLQLEAGPEIKVYRVSGSAFAILLNNSQENSPLKKMRKLVEQVKQFNFICQKRRFHINAVFSLVPADFMPGELHGPLEHASSLAEKAYDQGNIGSVIVSDEDQDRKHRITRADWLGKINETLAKDLFTLVAQPIVPIDKSDGFQHGSYFEILLRLTLTDGRLEMPEQFISHAESFNLMPNVDRWVVRHALKLLSSEEIDMQSIGFCSINLSGQSIADPTFCSDIEDLISENKVPPQKLCFEITETTAISNMQIAFAFISRLQTLGCSIALDDFGSGLSSFEYLKKLPINILKIDGIFIHNLPHSKIDHVIVDAIRRVAETMDLKTVAEYVESEEILQLLSKMGVTYAQGFHTGRPVPLEELLLKIGGPPGD